jgi:DNA-binding MarR family transcriptional regulator
MKNGTKSTPKASEMGFHTQTNAARRHLGHLIGDALRHFDMRVLHLMSAHPDLPLALANLAARNQITAALIHLTRHLPPKGARATHLAHSAGLSKQSMSDVLEQCEAWGLIERRTDPLDARAKWVTYTETGRVWLTAFVHAVQLAENEFRDNVGEEVSTVVRLGLEAYAHGY